MREGLTEKQSRALRESEKQMRNVRLRKGFKMFSGKWALSVVGVLGDSVRWGGVGDGPGGGGTGGTSEERRSGGCREADFPGRV